MVTQILTSIPRISRADYEAIDQLLDRTLNDPKLSKDALRHLGRVDMKLTEMQRSLEVEDFNGYVQAAVGDLHYSYGLSTGAPIHEPLPWTVEQIWHGCIGELTAGRDRTVENKLVFREEREDVMNYSRASYGQPILLKAGFRDRGVYSLEDAAKLKAYYWELDLSTKEKERIGQALDTSREILQGLNLGAQFWNHNRLFNNETIAFYHANALAPEDRARLDLAELDIWSSCKNYPLYEEMTKPQVDLSLSSFRNDFAQWYLEQEFNQPERMNYFLYHYKKGLLEEVNWHRETGAQRFSPSKNH